MSGARPRIKRSLRGLLALVWAWMPGSGTSSVALADPVMAAVAANFVPVIDRLAVPFHEATGHEIVVSAGASGTLYAQIRNGAPFEVFLSADAQRPRRLEASGDAVAGSRFTYARGRLVLWSARADFVDGSARVLEEGTFAYLALANPEIAPYGIAARAVLRNLGLWEQLQPRLVHGENITQTYQFVASGNAELGFVALAQVNGSGGSVTGWLVPPAYHGPIDQQAVLLTRGENRPAARAFMSFLASEKARALIRAFGYDTP